VDSLSGQLWEAGTIGVQETDTEVIATFESNTGRADLLHQFASYAPHWEPQPTTDWVEATQRAWPGRFVGERLFLAPPWCVEPTPTGRVRLIHNPGLACGTGEHPCSQLALQALERHLQPGFRIIDVGTGSGILAIAALLLGAASAIGIDTDEAALHAAKENFALNLLPAPLAAGTADCLPPESADIVLANISATVLLSIADELLGLVAAHGCLILTGFPAAELPTVQAVFGAGEVTAINGWSCVCVPAPSPAFDRLVAPAQTSLPLAGTVP
jgi:ribosomal protein L11 methyltransferase